MISTSTGSWIQSCQRRDRIQLPVNDKFQLEFWFDVFRMTKVDDFDVEFFPRNFHDDECVHTIDVESGLKLCILCPIEGVHTLDGTEYSRTNVIDVTLPPWTRTVMSGSGRVDFSRRRVPPYGYPGP